MEKDWVERRQQECEEKLARLKVIAKDCDKIILRSTSMYGEGNAEIKLSTKTKTRLCDTLLNRAKAVFSGKRFMIDWRRFNSFVFYGKHGEVETVPSHAFGSEKKAGHLLVSWLLIPEEDVLMIGRIEDRAHAKAIKHIEERREQFLKEHPPTWMSKGTSNSSDPL